MFDLDLLSERARVAPGAEAVVSIETGERITYAELDARTERAAETLRALLNRGDRFGILAYNCIEFLELFFAAGRAGVIAVPLSTRATDHELEHIARDCDMRALFYGDEFAGRLSFVDGRFSVKHRETSQKTDHRKPTTSEKTYCLLYT